MKQVVVLLQNEEYKNDFLDHIGKKAERDQSDLYLCMATYSLKTIFTYQKFGLMTCDKKVIDYIGSKHGLIIVLSEIVSTHVLKRITDVINNLPKMPIMILLDSCFFPPFQLNNLQHVKIFHLDRSCKRTMFDDIHTTNEPTEWINEQVMNYEVNNTSTITSKNISAIDMMKQFENETMPVSIWDHYGRLRMVYCSLVKYGLKNTIDKNGWLCTNWKKYKASIGHGNLWHYTLTRFWTELLYSIATQSKYNSFADLYEKNSKLHSGKLFEEYYTRDALFTATARQNWVKPDLKNI